MKAFILQISNTQTLEVQPQCWGEENNVYETFSSEALIQWRRSAPRHSQRSVQCGERTTPIWPTASVQITQRNKPPHCPWSRFKKQWVGSLLSTQSVWEDNASSLSQVQKRGHTLSPQTTFSCHTWTVCIMVGYVTRALLQDLLRKCAGIPLVCRPDLSSLGTSCCVLTNKYQLLCFLSSYFLFLDCYATQRQGMLFVFENLFGNTSVPDSYSNMPKMSWAI